jgi:predicted short-subunit dehydrogenase-like oxidoreductase (DUF2520 family)
MAGEGAADKDKEGIRSRTAPAGSSLRVLLVGRGRVGSALGSALRRCRVPLRHLRARTRWPSGPVDADLVILAVRDAEIATVAHRLARSTLLPWGRRLAAVHCSGSLGPEALEPLRARGVAVAQMHPLLAFAARAAPPSLAGAAICLRGDRSAVRRARALARVLGMRAVSVPRLRTALYHASAALVANGATALAAVGAMLLRQANVPAAAVPAMLGRLLQSVGENVTRLGVPQALTGPIRRGDAASVSRHVQALAEAEPKLLPLFLALATIQADMAAALGEAIPAELRAVRAALRRAATLQGARGAARRPRATRK